jgi:hypothetical protein
MSAAAPSKGARAGTRSVNTMDCPRGVGAESARAVFDPRGVVGAECLLAPCISHLEGLRLDVTKWNAGCAGLPGSAHESRS